MGKELTAAQKELVKVFVTREVAEGPVKCNYCDKEITSRNVDRWASHLRGCVKTPADIKAQIQPHRDGEEAPPAPTSAAGRSVHVSTDYMKFNAAHFIAYKGFREKLHGHNYRLAVTITGQVGPDGYVVDFGEIKKISRVICKDLNESFLVPMNSDALKISFDGTNVHILTEDNAKFSFPKSDCSLLPIVHSSAEELAIYISNQLIDSFTIVALLERGVRKLEVSISEANQQFATYERTILA
ncbi:hypothetical protein PHYSODRAFT_471775 [Phytophthora sojae]|uniref:6-pyruvoyltetrahydropterin synthase n=1 Tax=Phytophthora sojae (strain P6497) TaxID=1094619 RepID=G4YL66_PHYSP|nr:hypothetical protein PHYSODRAFT_471775 [Phytophthora sojae]EGZ29981.1 hypothetical protein PHYSODRAFT_471775 [Phytophthora sojae]|eukprot:XP_009517256.1 hypothetical protein PHYSODRAFT_471775 [Phytophthora sojae]